MYGREAMTEDIAGSKSVGPIVRGNYKYGKDADGITLSLEKPGDFTYNRDEWNKIIGMFFICPCGCKGIKIISFGPRLGRKPIWTWNGNIKKPILTPALQCVKGNCKFNLVRGVFRRC